MELGPPANRKWVSASHYNRVYRRTEAGRADAARRLARRRLRRRQWRAAGLCIRCGAPTTAGWARCRRCGDNNNRDGICTQCGERRDPEATGVWCSACRRSDRDRRRRLRIRRALAGFEVELARQADRLRGLRHPGGRAPHR